MATKPIGSRGLLTLADNALFARKADTDAMMSAADTVIGNSKWDRGTLAADLNTVQSSGRWNVTSTTLANLPTATAGELVVAWGSTTGIQRYTTRQTTPKVYYRRYTGSTWEAWNKGENGARLDAVEAKNATQDTDITNARTNAVADAKTYTDGRETVIRTDYAVADTVRLQEAKIHANDNDVIHEDNAVGRAVADAELRYGGLPQRVTDAEAKNTQQDLDITAAKWDKGTNTVDLNTVQSSGRWAVNSTTVLNLPLAVAGTVHVNWGATTGTQTYITREATPRVYHRAYLAGAWGAWSSVLTDAKAYTDAQKWVRGALTTNANDAQSPGFWTVASNLPNLPVALSGTLTSLWGSNVGTHIYTTLEEVPRVYYRRYVSGVFGPWSRGPAWERGALTTDANDAKSSGYWSVASNLPNLPVALTGTLNSFWAGSSGVHVYTSLEEVPQTWYRRYVSGAFGPWNKGQVGARLDAIEAKNTQQDADITALGKVVPPQPPTATKFSGWAYGDSWTGATYGTAAWPALLRDYMWLFTMYNRGVAGSRIQNVAVHAQAPGTAATWTPGNKGMVVVGALLNNQVEADDANNRDTAYESMRSLVARFSAATIREDTDPAFTFNGSWLTFTDPMPSGGSARYVNPTLATDAFHTDTVTVTVPAGVNYIQFVGLAPEMGTGATFTLHDSGGAEVARQRTDARSRTTTGQGLGEGKRAPVVMRVPGTTGGVFTLKVTTPPGYAGAVLGYVDCLLTLAEEPPMVVLMKPAHVTHPSYQKAALETYLRTIPDTMATEFSNVVVSDPNLGFDPTTMLGADLLHPVDSGHKHVTAAIRDAVNATALRRSLILHTPGLLG